MAPTTAPSATSEPRTPPAMLARLCAMMFLQYWPLGVWIVTVWTYLAENTGDQGTGVFTTRAIGYCLAAGAIGSLVSPAVFGWIADRFYAAERLLGGLHILAAAALWVMWRSDNEWAFIVACFVYFHLYIPTISLTNTIALRHLRDVEAEFPVVRVFATIAWISAGLFIGLAWPLATGENIEPTATPLLIGVVAGIVMAGYSLTLPHTPPSDAALDFGDAEQRSGLWRNGPFLAFLIVTIFACAPSQAYNLVNTFLNQQGYEYAAAKLILGQTSEVFCMLFMPLLITRIGLKRLFLVGVVIWAIRFLMLSLGAATGWAWVVYLAIVIHGPSYVFVYVAGQLFVDRMVHPARRGAAQGWHTVASSGLGHLFGAVAVGRAQAALLTPDGVTPPPYRWAEFWLVPATIGVVAACLAAWLIRGSAGARRAPVYQATDAPPSPADALT